MPNPFATLGAGARRVLASPRWLSVLGILSAGVIVVNANVLTARFYHRWDLTRTQEYSLSDATHQLLRRAQDPVELVVLIARDDPLSGSVRQMLAAYQAEAPHLGVRYVDPETKPAEFAALESKYGLSAGRTEDGRSVADAAILVVHASKHWFITTSDLVDYEEQGRARSKLEQALSEGIARVLTREQVSACFTSGHRELPLDSAGPDGLTELKRALERDNFEVREVAVTPATAAGAALSSCKLVIVMRPELPFEPASAERLERHLEQGGSLLLMQSPLIDASNRVVSSGLERVALRAGIELGGDYLIEQDPTRRLPQGLGESFFARPEEHDITKDLTTSGDAGVLLVGAQSLRRATETSTASPLLSTSEKAIRLTNVRALEQGNIDSADEGSDENTQHGPFHVAMAAVLGAGSAGKPPGRIVVLGSSSLARSRILLDPGLLGGTLFLQNSIAWLAARPLLVAVPQKEARALDLNLTEDSLAEVLRYVLIYMPLSAAGLGVFVLIRRRRGPRSLSEARDS